MPAAAAMQQQACSSSSSRSSRNAQVNARAGGERPAAACCSALTSLTGMLRAAALVLSLAPVATWGATPHTTEYAVDGVPGHTTYRLYIDLGSAETNVYTLVGTHFHPASFPPVYQLAPPFGVNVGGPNPAYFPYMAGCEYDSYITVGPNPTAGVTGSAGASFVRSGLSTIGIDFDQWTETSGVSFNNGALFYMVRTYHPVRAGSDVLRFARCRPQIMAPVVRRCWHR
jgi:hypothetical protein